MSRFDNMSECAARVHELCRERLDALVLVYYESDYDSFCAQCSKTVFERVVCNNYFDECAISYKPGNYTDSDGVRYGYRVTLKCNDMDMECVCYLAQLP